jgi:hypothetical protein
MRHSLLILPPSPLPSSLLSFLHRGPNTLGLASGLVQLALFAKYGFHTEEPAAATTEATKGSKEENKADSKTE